MNDKNLCPYCNGILIAEYHTYEAGADGRSNHGWQAQCQSCGITGLYPMPTRGQALRAVREQCPERMPAGYDPHNPPGLNEEQIRAVMQGTIAPSRIRSIYHMPSGIFPLP